MNCILVFVIIPVYKVEKYLVNSVESVINQTYKNIKIILIDDGSPDNCPFICDELAQKHDSIAVIHQKNSGLSSARNAGLKAINQIEAENNYVLFHDSDDTLYPGAIENLLNAAVKNNADVVIPDRYTKVYEKNGKKELAFHFKKDSYINSPVDFVINVIIGKSRAWRASSVLYKLNLLIKNNILFPVGYINEDIVLNLHVMTFAKKLCFYSKETMCNLKRSGSLTSSFSLKYIDSMWLVNSKVELFLKNTDNLDAGNIHKKYSLLCHLVIINLILAMSNNNFKKGAELADTFLFDERVMEAFTKMPMLPYYNKKYIILFYFLMFKVMQKKQYWLVKILAYITGILKQSIH